MKKQDVLFIAHRIPYPPDKGDKIRSYHMLRHLAERYRVTVACMIDDPADVRHIDPLRGMVHQVFHEVRTPLGMKLRAVGSLVTGNPFTMPCFYSHRLQQDIDCFLDHNDVRAVLCFCSSAAEYVFRSRHYPENLKKKVLLTDLVDVDSEKWRQYAEHQSGPMRWIYQREGRLLLPYEQRIIDAFDRTFLVSEAEKGVLAQYGSVAKVEALSNGVDLEYFSPRTSPPDGEKTAPVKLVFSGAMDYWPNVEGAVWFAQNVFPMVRKVFPEAIFCVAGRNPDQAVVELQKISGIEVTGTIPDMRAHLATATLCVVPLQIARGIQNKVLEGMAMQKPVVATPGAATGLKAVFGTEIVVAEDNTAMAQAIIDLLNNPERQREIGRKAREYVEREHSWESHLCRLSELIDKNSAEC
jgi:sugar transferase (PEP-CTERM/EpsH1 system associated)